MPKVAATSHEDRVASVCRTRVMAEGRGMAKVEPLVECPAVEALIAEVLVDEGGAGPAFVSGGMVNQVSTTKPAVMAASTSHSERQSLMLSIHEPNTRMSIVPIAISPLHRTMIRHSRVGG